MFGKTRRSAAGAVRRLWLPVRRSVIPIGSRRDRAYRAFRHLLARTAEPSAYRRFQELFEPTQQQLAAQQAEVGSWPAAPTFTVVTAVQDASPAKLQSAAASLLRQTYPHWQWHVADLSPRRAITGAIDRLASADPRIHQLPVSADTASAAINTLMADGDGKFVVLFDALGDLAPSALYRFAATLRDREEATDWLYADADQIDRHGRRHSPRFAPDWSPELLATVNYIASPVVVRRTLLDRVGYLDAEYRHAFQWDLYLRLAEQSQACVHVPEVLYHRRELTDAPSPAITAERREEERRAVLNHLLRRGLHDVAVDFDDSHPIRRRYPQVTWESHNAMVSIVIPSLDQAGALGTCLDGLTSRTARAALEIVIVDTGSWESATLELYDRVARQSNVKIVQFTETFNFSKACNLGVRRSSGDVVLLLNNDIEIIDELWLVRMLQWLEVQGVGIVGPKLLYPDGRVNHGGVAIGVGGLASQLFAGDREYAESVFGPEGWYRNVSAVTGACLLTTRRLYESLGGLDERFTLNYSDIDFCLRARAAGWRIVFTPDARLVHHESLTHGRRIPRSDFVEASRAFEQVLRSGDPFFNRNLTCRDTHPSLRQDERDTPWDANRQLMERLPTKTLIQLPDDVLDITG
jgi:GT2 family glycosyltransferase